MDNFLTKDSYRFDFVQAVRLIYLTLDEKTHKSRHVGFDNPPQKEIVKFGASVDLRHSSSDVRVISRLNDEQYYMEVSFLGLIGASGVMPYHYTRMLARRLKDNNQTLRDFFDLLHHRLVSNFFRACTKYRLPIQYECLSYSKSDFGDLITRSLACTVGFGQPTLRGRLAIDDRLFLYYAGHFSNERPTKLGLIRMLREVTGLNVDLQQFQLEWLHLEPADQTQLSFPYSQLGINTVVGSRVHSIQNRFRIRLGELTWAQFLGLLPGQRKIKSIADFTRTYVGTSLDFDFQLVLYGSEVKPAQLGDPETTQLGRTCWLKSEPFQHNVEDVIFEVPDSSKADF